MKKKFFIISIYILINLKLVYANALENKIVYRIKNEIITSYDIKNEFNYLKILNSKILDLNKDTIFEISENSIIKEKIKKIELEKYFKDINIKNEYFEKILKDNYTRIGLKSKLEFNNLLNQSNLTIEDFRKKITIEALWGQLIYQKYINQIKIDEKEINKKISNLINKKTTSYNLSEIIFNIENNDSLEAKYQFINNEIEKKGFGTAALLHSISQSSNISGELGWVNENSINSTILDQIKKLEIGNYTKPIIIPGGFLILRLNDLKQLKNNLSIDKKKAISEMRQSIIKDQLDQFSNIYYNKIKKNLKIEKI